MDRMRGAKRWQAPKDLCSLSGQALLNCIYLTGIVLGIICLFGIFLLSCEKADKEFQGTIAPIRVEVLNGCGEKGAARKFTTFLRRKGFDVCKFGNAENFDFTEAIVVDREGSPWKAEKVAKALGATNCIQQIKENTYRIEEVLVIIGRDLHELAPGKDLGR